MGLIRAVMNATSSTLGDQFREFFYCDSLSSDILVAKGQKRTSEKRNTSNVKGENNIISNGSKVAINEGQCMIIVDQGKVAEVCAEAGEFIYDNSSEPSIFYGPLGENIKKSFAILGQRFTFGGDPAKDQRVYYINTKEIIGNKYGTMNPVPFRVVDNNIGMDIDISIRCNGEYSYKIVDPVLFYTNVCGNVESEYNRESIDSQLKSELLTALQPAFARISDMGVRYSNLPAHTTEIADALNDILSEQWSQTRGIEVVKFGVNTVKASDEDEAMIKELQKTAVFSSDKMARASTVQSLNESRKLAAGNTATGPIMALAGVNLFGQTSGMAGMAGGFNGMMTGMGDQMNGQMNGMNGQMNGMNGQMNGMNGQNNMVNQTANVAATAALAGWACSCGKAGNTGKFCAECGARKPEEQTSDGWTCPTCGVTNKGKFCVECGAKKPVGEPLYKCDKCGWEPKDPHNPPKFCPECGDPFNESDIQ